jgi:hypothetical protein
MQDVDAINRRRADAFSREPHRHPAGTDDGVLSERTIPSHAREPPANAVTGGRYNVRLWENASYYGIVMLPGDTTDPH